MYNFYGLLYQRINKIKKDKSMTGDGFALSRANIAGTVFNLKWVTLWIDLGLAISEVSNLNRLQGLFSVKYIVGGPPIGPNDQLN